MPSRRDAACDSKCGGTAEGGKSGRVGREREENTGGGRGGRREEAKEQRPLNFESRACLFYGSHKSGKWRDEISSHNRPAVQGDVTLEGRGD